MDESGLYNSQEIASGPVFAGLAEARRRLAAQWLDLSPAVVQKHWGMELGKIHRMLVDAGLRDQLAEHADEVILARIEKLLQSPQSPSAGGLLAAILYHYPYELPKIYRLELLPTWFTQIYLEFMQVRPELFREPGDAEQYLQILTAWTAYIEQGISSQLANRHGSKLGRLPRER